MQEVSTAHKDRPRKRRWSIEAVPGLGSALVLVVDGVQVVVLHMPGKGGGDHADVEHGGGHAGYLPRQQVQRRAGQLGQYLGS